MTSQKQILANRNNAKLSTGPITDEGKEHTKYNALKHGCRAATLVIMPNENPAEHVALVDDWLTRLKPANPAEEHLIRHAADLTWLIDRAKWQEGQLLYQQISDAMAQAERARVDHNQDAFRKLLPTAEEARASRPYHLSPNQLRTIVESTADGCNLLLSVWRGLRATTLGQQPWNDLQESHAVRLLGFGDKIIYDPEMLDLVVANRFVRDPSINKNHWSDGPCGLHLGWTEIDEALARKPTGINKAIALLINTADRAIARLEGVLAERKRDGDLGVVKAINPVTTHVIIDPSVDVEKMRKYRESLSRELFRTLDVLGKVRKEEDRRRNEMGIGANEAISTVKDAAREIGVPGEPSDRSRERRSPDRQTAPASAANEAISSPENGANEAIVQVMNAMGDDRAAKIGAPIVLADSAEAPPANRWERRRRAALARQAMESKNGR